MVQRSLREFPSSPVHHSYSKKCCCLNVEFLKSKRGMLKVAEAIFGGICQSLLVNYGYGVAVIIGNSYSVFLTNASACLLTTCLLLFSYIISENTLRAIQKSVFEIVFNVVAMWLYLGAASYLLVTTTIFLWPLYLVTPFFQAYPAMTAAASLGFVVAVVHGADAYYAVQAFRGR